MQPNPSTAVTCLPLLTPDECDALLAELDGAAWTDGPIELPADARGIATEIRRCAIVEVRQPSLLERLEVFVRAINDGLFGFALDGFHAADPVAAMRYGPGGHFAWHLDNATAGAATRKLSFTVQLTDPAAYEGGDLELAMYAPAFGGAGQDAYRAQIRQRGAITIFPAFHLHRVSPVTAGTRTALVGWLHGPRFR